MEQGRYATQGLNLVSNLVSYGIEIGMVKLDSQQQIFYKECADLKNSRHITSPSYQVRFPNSIPSQAGDPVFLLPGLGKVLPHLQNGFYGVCPDKFLDPKTQTLLL